MSSPYTSQDLDEFARELIFWISHRELSLADRNRLLFLIRLFRRERDEHLETCYDCLPQETRDRVEREQAEIVMLDQAFEHAFPAEIPPEGNGR